MAFAVDVRRLAAGAAAVAVSGVLLWFGTGLDPAWPLLWIAPVPVLIFAAGAAWPAAALAAAAAWLLGMLNVWHYLHGGIRLPPVILVEMYGGETLAFVLAVLLFRALLRRGRVALAIVGFGAAWVAFEYVNNLTSPHGTAGSLAYAQLGFVPFLQLASVTGPWGMSFAVMALPAALAAAWQLRGRRRVALAIVGAAAAVLAAIVMFGALRIAAADRPTVKVGLVASDPPVSPEVADAGAATDALLAGYAHAATGLAAQGAQVIVLPEKLGVAVDPDTARSDAEFQAIADRTHAVIVVGLVRVAPPVKYNEARIYTPGAPVQHYDKRHMLPPFELPFTPGSELAVLPRTAGNWGVAICKDMDFTPLSRDYGRAGVGLMLVPAWDFVIDRLSHGHMAILRGVESGFSVARAGKRGLLTVSDNRGRIVAETTSDAAPFATLLADVPASHADTLYLALGDWFAYLALAGLAAALVALVRPRRAPR